MNRKRSTAKGTDNVLLDLGFEDAEELSVKAVLALKLNQLIDKRGLNQVEAAAITGMTQPKVSQVRRYKLQNISLERLMQALVSLDQHVEIVVHAQDAAAPAPTPAAPGSGREYLMSRAAARRHAEAMYDDLTAGLSAHCRESRRLQASEEVRVACLVPAGETESVLAAVESWAGAQQGRRVTTTGPWPPFSFTEKETG